MRFDVEYGDAQRVRADPLDELGFDGQAALADAGFSWDDTAQHQYKFVGKPILLSQLGDQSLVDVTVAAIDERWAILEAPITTVVQRHEPEEHPAPMSLAFASTWRALSVTRAHSLYTEADPTRQGRSAPDYTHFR